MSDPERLPTAPPAPLPNVTADTEAFWRGGRDGLLNIARCGDCGFYMHPPMPICTSCLSSNVAPKAVSGRGRLATFTINYQPWTPAMTDPFVIGVVELAEQANLRVTTNVVDTPLDRVRIGMPLRVTFIHREDVWLPVFVEDQP